jgi:[protein-PII] uridylyltransferase
MTSRSGSTRERAALFSALDFSRKLAEGVPPIPLFKSAINTARELLNQRFINGAKAEVLISDYSWFIDQILTQAWSRYPWNHASDISLVAVGGYGRGELHPYSDIDIQILLQHTSTLQQYKEHIESFLTFLWDINLEVGQSVRTVNDNIDEAAKDITIATALLEARTVHGNPLLLELVMTRLSQKRIWRHKSFFAAKKAEQIERHRKHEDVEYSLEPNLKASPGGLRDIQTISWIARHYFGTGDFRDLVVRGFLQKDEYRDLIRGRNFLWKLRWGLHMLNGRREDRLLFDNQRKLAELFGYQNDSKSLAIEKLMKQYYQSVLTLRQLNDVLLQLFDEEILCSGQLGKAVTLNSRFQLRNHYIEARHNRVFEETPMALIEVFVLMGQDRSIEGIRASTIRLIRNSLSLIDDKYRKDSRNTTMFMELLRSPYAMVAHLRKMKLYGVLSAYLPEFGRIVGQMQHDLFHIYTVDDHTLQVMENMRRLRHPEAEERFPVASQVIKQLPKIELLYIAGLYHDIAKGRGGDHSILGIKDAERFCKRHHLGKWDTSLVAWLVQNHLLMSGVAQREDIDDPQVIKDFALRIGDQIHLDYLYVLTICDINGTNPSLWNTWRASLLRKLYSLTKRALTQGLEIIVGKEDRIKDTQNRAMQLLRDKGYTRKQVLQLWNSPHEDYFLRESEEDIVWLTEALAAQDDPGDPLILIRNTSEQRIEGATQVLVKAVNSSFLFANLTTAFDRMNLSIQAARMYQMGEIESLSIFMILEADGTPVQLTRQRLQDMHKTLLSYVLATQALPTRPGTGLTRKQRHFTRNTLTALTTQDDQPYSILEVICPDRQGLLALIAHIFVDMGIRLHNAKITTLGENVEDVFFITGPDQQPLRDTALGDALQETIRTRLDQVART